MWEKGHETVWEGDMGQSGGEGTWDGSGVKGTWDGNGGKGTWDGSGGKGGRGYGTASVDSFYSCEISVVLVTDAKTLVEGFRF